MNWADWTIIAIFALSIVIGMVRGFVREALSLLIWVAAFALAMLFHARLAVYLTDMIDTPSLRYIVAWVAIFVAVLLVGALVSFMLSRLVSGTGLGGTDRLLGTLFGGLRGFVVVMALLIILPGMLPVTQDGWWHESRLIPEFLRFEGWARDMADLTLEFFSSLF